MTAAATSSPTTEDAILPAELTDTGGTTVGVTVGPIGVLVGVGVDVIGVVPDR